MHSVSEAEVGVTQFMSDNQPFEGIIKHRYMRPSTTDNPVTGLSGTTSSVIDSYFRWSDFHVRDISLNGEVARITSLDKPDIKPETKQLPVDEFNFDQNELTKLEELNSGKGLY